MPGFFRKRGTSYQLIVTMGTDYDGKPIRYTKTLKNEECRTDAQAKKALAVFYADCVSGKAEKPSLLTVGNICDMYMDEHVRIHKKKTTLRGYETIISRIQPLFKQKAETLTKLKVQRWINDYLVKEHEYSPKTIKNTVSFLHAAYKWAITMDILKRNPCDNVSLPAQEHKEAEYYTEEEVDILMQGINELSEDFLNQKVAMLLAIFGGLRKGEICGLNWEDVKENGVLIVRTRNIGVGIGIYEDTPKTERSNRFISLPAEVMDELQHLQRYQESLEAFYEYDSPAVIRNNLGKPIWPNSLAEWISRFQESLGLKRIVLHGLRHTHASMLIGMHADVSQVSGRLGHAQKSTTLNRYTHLFKQNDTDMLNNMSERYLK